ncbi:MAG TPA: SGNH/GDSL hydrolase family protein [Verrucomicrobiae bacterium]|nr:SGNH/GDSL hydrolase family protein [Verrucomicrobiae bacterium]
MKLKRILLVLLLGIILVCGAASYLHFWLSRPMGNGPAGPAVSKEAFSKVWSTNEILLVGLGDSVTAGFGARKGYSYFDRLVANPSDEFEDMRGICLKAIFPNLRYTNLAVSGSTSMEHAEKQVPKLLTVNSNIPAIVVITSGGNDLIHNYGHTPPREDAMYGATFEEAKPWIGNFGQRMDSMIQQIEKHFSGNCEIFIADIYDPTDGQGDLQRTGLPQWKDAAKILGAYNGVIHDEEKKTSNVHVVNMHEGFLGHGIHCTQFWAKTYDSNDPHYWYYVNLEDPNERGYDALRRMFLIKMQKAFGPTK